MPKNLKVLSKGLTKKELDDPNAFAISAILLDEKPTATNFLPLQKEGREGLTYIVSQVPGFAVNVAAAKSQFYELRFAPEIIRGLSDGTYHIVQSLSGGIRATAASHNGRFVGNGSLHPPKAFKAAAIGTALWQVASVAVGQKHLSDISAKLEKLSADIQAISNWLVDERQGELLGKLDYLEEITGSILSGNLEPDDVLVYRQNLEGIEIRTREITFAIEKQLYRTIYEASLRKRRFFNAGADEVVANLRQYRRLIKEWHLAMRVRVVVAQLSCFLLGGERQASGRCKSMSTAINRLQSEMDNVMAQYLANSQVKGNVRNLFALLGGNEEPIYHPQVREDLLQLYLDLAWSRDEGAAIKETLGYMLDYVETKKGGNLESLRLAVEVDRTGRVISAICLAKH